jgi:hypothetical protein
MGNGGNRVKRNETNAATCRTRGGGSIFPPLLFFQESLQPQK